MDQKLIAWARAVKARARGTARARLPTLWVFSDRERLPDPAPVLRTLPKGLCGLVLRLGGMPDRAPDPATLRRALAIQRALAICRARRFAVVVAGTGIAQARVGRHYPRLGGIPRHGAGLRTAAAHDRAELVRAGRAGVDCVFLSPAFATLSHPGAPALGAVRWSGLAHSARTPVMALGGVAGASAARLPRCGCAGAAVIGAALGE